MKPATEVSTSPRLMSLDALRGFDMFWIVGAEAIVHALHKVSEAGPIGLLARQLTHKKWQGLAFYDLIFPLFVFIVGVSLVFSLTRSIEQHGRAATFRRIVRRSVLLYLIGIIYYGGIADGVAHIRLLGVLQRIALAYFFAGLVFMTFRLRGMVLICILLLVVYWGLMTFVPVPGVGAGNFEQGKNLANYIDRHYLPLRKWDGDHDPEGLLSTMPAIATCLLGVFVGLLMKTRQITEQRKVLWLLVAGAAGIALGHLWGLQFPIIKKVWTSSYVLVAAGWSCIFLACFHQVIEVWRLQRWSMPFVWIGMNAITIYLAGSIVDAEALADRFVGGPIKAGLGNWGPLAVAVLAMAFVFAFARFLYRRRVFLRL